MKQKILDALKTKFAGVKDEILDRIATKGAKTVTDEEGVKTYVEGLTMQNVLDAYGDFRATEATKTAVTNYEKKHNIKDGKPVKTEQEQKTEDTDVPQGDVPAWAQALIDSNKAMAERLDKIDGEKTAKTRMAKLEELLAEASDKTKARYTKNFARYNFKDDEDFDSWLEEQKADIEEDIKADKANGITPPKGGGSVDPKTVNPLVAKRVEARSKENVPSAIQG